MKHPQANRWLPAFIPYVAMVVGLYLLSNAWLSFLIYHGLVLIAVGKDRTLLGELGRGWQPAIGLGAVCFGLAGGVLLFSLAPYAQVDAALIHPVLAKLGLTGRPWLLFVLYHALINPWFEELLWRGRLGHDSLKPVAEDFLFAGYHVLVLGLFLAWIWILPAFVLLVAAGWFWRQLRRRQGGLLLPVISHMAADGGIMGVVYWLGRN